MNESEKQQYVEKMIENLPVLRAKLKLTQKDLAEIIGVSHYSISGMESRQRKMTWNTFMSILPVFMENEETNKLLRVLGIYTEDLESFIKQRKVIPLRDKDLYEVAAAGMPVHDAKTFKKK